MNSNWEEFGEEVRQIVQDAVDHHNYERLNQVISDTVNRAADAVTNGIRKVAEQPKKAEQPQSSVKKQVAPEKKYSGIAYSNVQKADRNSNRDLPLQIPSKGVAVVFAVMGYIFGSIGFLFFWLSFIFVWISRTAFTIGAAAVSGIFGIFAVILSGVGFGIGIFQTRKLARIKRFQTYLGVIGGKEYCNISDMIQKSGFPEKKVCKDLEYMIRKKWFRQGYFDKQKTCLMVTDRMYEQYCQLEKQKALEQKEEALRKQSVSAKTLAPEIQKVIDRGDEYVRKIRACNDAIPGVEISEKIYHMEMLVEKIFDRVEKEPGCVSDIKKLMDYYLPTTVKLLDAYAEMDAQPVGGENIQEAKKEIEDTLDTLNTAFEKLLDSLFQETAWDVSSDISVLHTMLAQEGLKEDGLKKNDLKGEKK